MDDHSEEGTGTPYWRLCGKLQQFGAKGWQAERNRNDNKNNLWAFVLVSGLSPFEPRVDCQHTIHQVIWPSPGTLIPFFIFHGTGCAIDPEDSKFKNRKIRCRIIRFKSIFCEFSPNMKLDTGKRLEMIWNMYPLHMTSCVNGFPFDTVEKRKQTQCNCIEWLIKGGPEPSILDDLCLGNVIAKYFSKLRFCTNEIQPDLKCLENILFSFYDLFCGQGLENTSCLVFVHHSFPL